jgi:hypothetical protein
MFYRNQSLRGMTFSSSYLVIAWLELDLDLRSYPITHPHPAPTIIILKYSDGKQASNSIFILSMYDVCPGMACLEFKRVQKGLGLVCVCACTYVRMCVCMCIYELGPVCVCIPIYVCYVHLGLYMYVHLGWESVMCINACSWVVGHGCVIYVSMCDMYLQVLIYMDVPYMCVTQGCMLMWEIGIRGDVEGPNHVKYGAVGIYIFPSYFRDLHIWPLGWMLG